MRILLAVDGSDQSYEAARALSHLAPAEQVTILHALDVPKPGYPIMMPEVAKDIYRTVEKGMREDGERLLKGVTSLLPGDIGPTSTRLEVGKAVDVILSVAEREHADLILMGTRGRSAIEEVMLGSVSHRVVAHAPCPVLVVNGPVPSLRSIVLAVEGAEDVDAAKRMLSLKPFKHCMEVTVLTVLPLGQPIWPGGISDTQSLREKALKCAWSFVWDVAGQLSPFGYQAGGLVGMGSPATAIIQQAAALNADLIMVGSRTKGEVSRFLLGSVSHGVLHRATRPVLVFR